MKQVITSRIMLTLMSLSAAIALSLAAAAVVADEPRGDERKERSQSSSDAADLGSYRVGAPGSSPHLRSRDRPAERPQIDREGLGLDRSDFALEPAFGSSGGMQLDMDIRPSRDDRSDRRVVEEETSASERRRARTDVEEQDIKPVLIEAPRYPRQAFRSRTEGHVTIEFTVGTDGRTHNARVLESRPRSVFDASALQAVERWEFEPRIVNGRPVETVLTQTIDFTLDD